jgi:transposase
VRSTSSAWLGLVPRQHASGDRERLLRITKRGNTYLRMLLIQGARSALLTAARHKEPVSRWSLALQERRGGLRRQSAWRPPMPFLRSRR